MTFLLFSDDNKQCLIFLVAFCEFVNYRTNGMPVHDHERHYGLRIYYHYLVCGPRETIEGLEYLLKNTGKINKRFPYLATNKTFD